MTDSELIEEIRLFRKDMKETRDAVRALARTSVRQKVFNGLVVFLFVAMLVGGYLVLRNAASDRDSIRHEACVSNRNSVINSRLANHIFFDTLVVVLVPAGDTQAQARADSLSTELDRQQNELLPVPVCS